MDNFDKAIKASQELSSSEGTGHRIINHHSEYLDGSLYVVEFDGNDGKRKTNWVYIDRDNLQVCKNEALLNEFVSRKSHKNHILSFLNAIGGISGILGILITMTIIGLLIHNPEITIPNILSTALSSILGFYFGSKTSK